MVLGNSPGRHGVGGGYGKKESQGEEAAWTSVDGEVSRGLETICDLLWPVRVGHGRKDLFSRSL